MDLLTSNTSEQERFKMKLQDSINEEQSDCDKYLQLAQEAPTEKERKILLDIAKEEMTHKKFLIELLSDMSKNTH